MPLDSPKHERVLESMGEALVGKEPSLHLALESAKRELRFLRLQRAESLEPRLEQLRTGDRGVAEHVALVVGLLRKGPGRKKFMMRTPVMWSGRGGGGAGVVLWVVARGGPARFHKIRV